jgi:aminoglycoside phosphotransferase (APT) family kinase protein
MFLEWIPAARRWPWADLEATSAVILQLARLHRLSVSACQRVLANPEGEREMAMSAIQTAELYHRSAIARPLAEIRPMHRAIERVAVDINQIRAYVASHTGIAVLHGDVHSGNAVLRLSADLADAVLIDWRRARLGSPLEDVASWLQSLAYWEPQVRRRHDTLLARYLGWAGWGPCVQPGVRRLYWLVAASNGMAGALRYHLAIVSDSKRSTAVRQRSARAVRDWMRVIRRADECWRRRDDFDRQTGSIRTGLDRTTVQ